MKTISFSNSMMSTKPKFPWIFIAAILLPVLFVGLAFLLKTNLFTTKNSEA